jgi:hypothetical protein
MRKLIESTFVSGPGRYWDDEHSEYGTKLLFGADALVLGRATYDGFSTSWPQRSGDPYSDRINAMPKHVASTTLTDTTWNATVLQGDVAAAVADLKEQPGQDLLTHLQLLDTTTFGSGIVVQVLGPKTRRSSGVLRSSAVGEPRANGPRGHLGP